MSKVKLGTGEQRADHSRKISGIVSYLGACAIVVATVLLTVSCGPATNAAAQGNNQAPQSLALSGSFPRGVAQQTYNSVLAVNGGNSPYQFSVRSGQLPPGVVLNPLTGSVSGTPTASGIYNFQIRVTDLPHGEFGIQQFAMIVLPPGGGGGGVQVTVAPSSVTLNSNQTQQFTAAVTGTTNTGVTWTASAGAITQAGLFTAPQVNQQTSVSVVASSVADPTKQGSAAVTVQTGQQQGLTITTGSLPDGQVGSTYSETLSASGGTPPYTWSASGSVPPGLSMNASSGTVSGTPNTAGTYGFTVNVADSGGQTAQKGFSVNISGGSGYDGPAQLPLASVDTSMSDTPAPGSVVAVNAGGDFQSALNNAQCGDTITLQAGASFVGPFTLPARSCDDKHWIVVRTSAPDNALPQEGQRITPCYAGVGSLPGRPQYSCNNPQNVMAQLMYQGRMNGPVILATGANHYRFIGLEITRAVGVKAAPRLISGNGNADHIIIDRSWLHGTPQDETQSGFVVSGMNYAAAIDSYFSDFHCTSGT